MKIRSTFSIARWCIHNLSDFQGLSAERISPLCLDSSPSLPLVVLTCNTGKPRDTIGKLSLLYSEVFSSLTNVMRQNKSPLFRGVL